MRATRKLNSVETAILWYLNLEAMSMNKIAEMVNLNIDEVKTVLENLEERNLVMQKGLLGRYALTSVGLEQFGNPEIKVSTKIQEENIKSNQETVLWVYVQNSGRIPVNNAKLKIVSPKFVTIQRYNSIFGDEETRKIVEFPLSQLDPQETQTVNFKINGFLTSGTLSSKYKIEIHAMVDGQETDKQEVGLFVES